jgi:drug/metabolite transporter (DMT)-like permease
MCGQMSQLILVRTMDIAVRRGLGHYRPQSPSCGFGTALRRACKPPGGVLVGLLALYACWGSSIPAMKLMVGGMPPLAGAGGVFLVGGLVLSVAGRHSARPTWRQACRAAGVGVLLLVGGQGLATVVLTKLTASLAAMLLATVPLWMAALRTRGFDAPKRRGLGRLVIGFIGVGVVLLTAPAAAVGGSAIAVVGCGAAPICWAWGSVRSADPDHMPNDPRTSAAIQLLTGGLVLVLIAAISGQLTPNRLGEVTSASLGAAGFLLFVDSLAGFMLYQRLLRTAPLALVGSYAYATPLVAAAIGIIVFGEHAWPGMGVGAVLIIVAVYYEVKAGADRNRAAPPSKRAD